LHKQNVLRIARFENHLLQVIPTSFAEI